MKHIAATYVVPQLPRLVFFPAVFVVKEVAVRWDVPIWALVALGLPVLVIVGALTQAGVTWLKGLLLEDEA